uniref:Glutamyl endopeptidase n=1 Tax=Anthurium amnicola TaxID=1678845 RepID=A0A1D1Y9Z4_9ARAE
MNKKHILCIFVVLILIITNSSYAFPKPLGKRAKLVSMSKSVDIPPEERLSNITKSFADGDNNFSAIGLLSFTKNDGSIDYCTATVIKSDNGNMVLTAAHCLWDIIDENWNSEFYFSPGYNNGNPGNLGTIRAHTFSIWTAFTEDETLYDYGFLKLYYPDGRKLQDDAGAFDWDFHVPPGEYQTTVFGYPFNSGGMDCPRDGQHLCEWQGNSFEFQDSLPNYQWHRGISVDVGYGSSGGPWIRNYDSNANTGNIMGVSHGFLPPPYPNGVTTSWSWLDDFSQLLTDAENYNPPS